jgi:hypothetical protein
MSYRATSQWNDENEIRCLVIFKKLEAEDYPRGKQMEYCREMSRVTNLDPGNISAKVCNYKSVAGVNNASNASVNTVELYRKYGHFSIKKLESLINKKQSCRTIV